ncbi:hypothetical protein [Corynebacterium haemomassiliense]|uniref:Transposase n=1 Tax=Corynebacterium haemomassiliense TaxID=2754726 RepID=A0A7W2EAR3_9CORY|nr:hypothetical protein [Corynebacterium haemomassiliense]MBA5244105.1 hypothetical protein [Corynebacterium haemomassiliense]
MTLLDVPVLIPEPDVLSEAASVGGQQVRSGRLPRRRLRADDVLSLAVTVLSPGEVLDEDDLVMPQAGAVVFTACQPYSRGLDFTAAQKRQMVTIYRQLPYGAKGIWLDRHGLYGAKIFRWGQQLGLLTCAQQKAASVGDEELPAVLDAAAVTSLVQRYLSLPYGEKEAFIARHDLCHRTVLRWATMVADGSIAHYTHKRKAGTVGKRTSDDLTQSRRQVEAMIRENERLKKELAKANRKRTRQEQELDKWVKTSDVLGKALASMPDLPGVDYDAEENAYPKTKRDAMKLVDKKNNDSSTPLSD